MKLAELIGRRPGLAENIKAGRTITLAIPKSDKLLYLETGITADYRVDGIAIEGEEYKTGVDLRNEKTLDPYSKSIINRYPDIIAESPLVMDAVVGKDEIAISIELVSDNKDFSNFWTVLNRLKQKHASFSSGSK